MTGPYLNICVEHMDMSSFKFILSKVNHLPEVVLSHVVDSVIIGQICDEFFFS
jgi:hypothetical protein